MPFKRAGFPKSRRILNATDYQQIFSSRQRFNGPLFRIFVGGNQQRKSRLGIAVSKRVSKKATQRNRIKRQIRESFRSHLKLFSGVDIVVVALAKCDDASNSEITASLNKHWVKIAESCKKC